MSGSVGSVSSRSGMVENMRVTVGVASPALSVQKLFHFRFSPPVFIDIFSFGYRPMSGLVGCAISKSGMIKMWGGR